LADVREVKLASLAGEPFVFFPRRLGTSFHDKLISFCADAGFLPDVVQEATQWQSIVSLVAAGMGVSVGPGCIQRFRWSGVVYRPLKRLRTTVSACWNPEAPSTTAAAFLKLVRTGFRQAR
jgi:DNA-binding transcriptional LysR family regulator